MIAWLQARGVPFAFASGYGEAGLTEDHKGATVLQKPFREADLRRLRIAREAVGPDLPIAVDANQVWGVGEARRYRPAELATALLTGRDAIDAQRVRALHERTQGNPLFVRQALDLIAQRGDWSARRGSGAVASIVAIDL